MEYTYGLQETSAAAAAIKALQFQLRELRQQTGKLQSELQDSQEALNKFKEHKEKQLETLTQDYAAKENNMKEDLIYLCQRVKYLEQENLDLIDQNHKLKEQIIEITQNERANILLQEEVQMLAKKIHQKESENVLLNKRINQLENLDDKSMKGSKSFNDTSNLKLISENSFDSRADLLDSELVQQKSEYREYLKNSNPSNKEWKQKVDMLRTCIESNSQELLRLRKEQYEHLRTQIEN